MQRKILQHFAQGIAGLIAVVALGSPTAAVAALSCFRVPTTLDGTPTPVASGNGQLSLGNNSTLSTTGSACSTPDGATCTDAVGNGTTLQAGLGVQPPAQTLPQFQPSSFPAVGGSNVTVNNGTLAAGSWGKVTLRNSVTFSGGNYYISEIAPDNSVTLTLAAGDYFVNKWSGSNNLVVKVSSGPVRIFVKTSFQTGNGSIFNASGSPANFQIYLYDGASASFGNSDNGNTDVSFNGLIYAPGAGTDIQFGNNNVIKGAVLSGGDVDFGNNTGVIYDASTQAAIASINLCNLSLDLRMDETSWTNGGSIADSSGNGLNGTLSGNASGVTAKVCNGGNLASAASNVITVPNSTRLDLAAGGTISFWIKPSDNSLRWLFGKGTDYYAYLDAGGKLVFGWDTSFVILPNIRLQSATTIPLNTWTHVALRLDDAAGKIHLHLNGNTSPDVTASTAISIVNSSSPLTLGNGFWPSGFIYNGVMDEFKIFKSVAYSAADIAGLYADEAAGRNFADGSIRACPNAGPEHVELVHDGSGINCAAAPVSVIACTSSASCNGVAASQFTGNFTITSLPTPAGAQWCLDAACTTTASFPMGFVNNTTQLFLREPAVRTDRIAGTANPATNTTLQCRNTATGTFNATSACDIAFAASGFVVSAPDHLSCSASTLTIQALKSGAPGTACTPAFSGTRTTTIAYSYVNPASGSRSPSVGGTLVSTTGTAIPLNFNASGVATPVFVYDDVGKIGITVNYTGSGATGDAGLTMTGSAQLATPRGDGSSDGVVVAPASFAVSSSSIAPDPRNYAGKPFKVTVKARNACSTPTEVANFGKEGAAMSLACTRALPAGANNCTTGPCDGIVSGCTLSSANGGSYTGTPTWSEFGQLKLTASLSGGNYLGFASPTPAADASTGTIHPHHFDTSITPACGSFSYAGLIAPAQAGQVLTVAATARNFSGGTTLNYDSSLAPGLVTPVTLSVVSPAASVGVLSGGTITAFAAGVGNASGSEYRFASRTTAPTNVTLHSESADTAGNTPYTDATTPLRSGRLRLLNGHGSELLDLPLTMRAEFFSGATGGWRLNTADTCTGNDAAGGTVTLAKSGSIANATCARDSSPLGRSGIGCASGAPIANRRFLEGGVSGTDSNGTAGFAGNFNLWLQAPGAGNTGAVTITSTVPSWMQFNWTGVVGSPSARATFGTYRSGPVILRRESF